MNKMGTPIITMTMNAAAVNTTSMANIRMNTAGTPIITMTVTAAAVNMMNTTSINTAHTPITMMMTAAAVNMMSINTVHTLITTMTIVAADMNMTRMKHMIIAMKDTRHMSTAQ